MRPSSPSARPRRRRRWLHCSLAAATLLVSAGVLPHCSLGNVSPDACLADAECVAAFGYGSSCLDGYCTPAAACVVDEDCPIGTCVDGFCSTTACESVGPNGQPCYACVPAKPVDFLNGCTDATCVVFDRARLTHLGPEGQLPDLP